MMIAQSDRERIERAVRAVEARTSGELVMVIAAASDAYLYIPLLWAAIIALALPGLLYPLGLDAYIIYLIQLVGFVGLSFLFQWTPLKAKLVPGSVKAERAGRRARECFFECGLHLTEGRTGVLIFVSLAEHYVEIIADSGIDRQVPELAWSTIVAQFMADVKAGLVADGFVRAAESAGDLLAEHCPRRSGDRDELPNRLVILD